MIGSLFRYGPGCMAHMLITLNRFVLRKCSYREMRSELHDAWQELRDDLMAPPTTPQRKDALRLVNKGVRLYNYKRYTEALTAFKDARDEDPVYARAWLYLGNTLYKLSQQGEALSAWERAVAVEPRSKAADKARTKIEHLRAKNLQAIEDLQELLRK